MLCKDVRFKSKYVEDMIEEYGADSILESEPMMTQEIHDQIVLIMEFQYQYENSINFTDKIIDLMRFLMIPFFDKVLDRWARVTGNQQLIISCTELGIELPCFKYIDSTERDIIERQGLLFQMRQSSFTWSIEHLIIYDWIECIKYLYELDAERYFGKKCAYLCNTAAGYGSIKSLTFLREKGYPLDDYTIFHAAQNGSLDCFKYLHEQGCRILDEVVGMAAFRGNVECLKYAVEHLEQQKTKLSHEFICKSISAFIGQDYTIKEKSLECLKYLRERGCKIFAEDIFTCIHFNRLDCLQYLHDDYCTCDGSTMEYAVKSNLPNMKIIEYLYTHGCEIDIRAVNAAAEKSRTLKILKYLHEHGGSCDATTTAIAAKNGNIDALMYLHEHGCPWDISTTKNAENFFYLYQPCRPSGAEIDRYLQCLKYAIANGCPYQL